MRFRVQAIPASQIIDSEKLAARPAGLGWIDRSCLFITSDYGPTVRFATVLTDARLDAGSPIDEKCGDCRECMDTCPVRPFKEARFDPSEPREARLMHACAESMVGREKRDWERTMRLHMRIRSIR